MLGGAGIPGVSGRGARAPCPRGRREGGEGAGGAAPECGGGCRQGRLAGRGRTGAVYNAGLLRAWSWSSVWRQTRFRGVLGESGARGEGLAALRREQNGSPETAPWTLNPGSASHHVHIPTLIAKLLEIRVVFKEAYHCDLSKYPQQSSEYGSCKFLNRLNSLGSDVLVALRLLLALMKHFLVILHP